MGRWHWVFKRITDGNLVIPAWIAIQPLCAWFCSQWSVSGDTRFNDRRLVAFTLLVLRIGSRRWDSARHLGAAASKLRQCLNRKVCVEASLRTWVGRLCALMYLHISCSVSRYSGRWYWVRIRVLFVLNGVAQCQRWVTAPWISTFNFRYESCLTIRCTMARQSMYVWSGAGLPQAILSGYLLAERKRGTNPSWPQADSRLRPNIDFDYTMK